MATGADGAGRNEPSTAPTWDGDKMFNIYIHDYCLKRGFKNTAAELQKEANIDHDASPPINAKQGLLFEWWSVFWLLFSAKTSATGNEDALTYTQAQVAKQLRPQGQLPPGRHNGMLRSGPPHMAGYSIPNGVASNGVPPTQGNMANGGFPGGAQPNGVPAPAGAAGSAASQQLQNMQQIIPGQRPGNAPPTGQQPPAPTMGGPQPLTQMNSIRGGMLPPNGPQGPMGSQQTPQQSFQQLGRSPSASGSPPQNNTMTTPSPLMANRQPPFRSAEYNQLLAQPPHMLAQLKQEAGVPGDKELLSLTDDEKNRMLSVLQRQRLQSQQQQQQQPPKIRPAPPGTPVASNAVPGPSGAPMQHLRNPQVPPHTPQQMHQQIQQQRGNKRNSPSPGQEPDGSPPDRKRARPSAAGGEQGPMQQPPMGTLAPPYPHQPQQGGPPQMMRQQMRTFPQGMPGMSMPMSGLTGQQIGGNMSPAMMNQPGPGGMMTPQMGQMNEQQYRATMHQLHQKNIPQINGGLIPGGAGASPSSSDLHFNMDASRPQGQFPGQPGPLVQRLGQNKGPGNAMGPPPSPSSKGMGTQIKDGNPGDSSAPNARPDSSPQNAAAGIGQGAGGPPQGGQTAPPTPGASNITPSPNALLNGSGGTPSLASSHPPGNPSDPSGGNMSLVDNFMMSELDTSMFQPEDLDFERDLGAWFNADHVFGSTSLD
ncbi:hypothetical protein WOLCODRAFT_140416 [Wolfiporia cocos MD-104 SS10]|uniref:Uncharacterized protein n=1 Tax=Wolfiporia cocos (strain MD-104) TaxID=742152 RepID=A0A2H3JKA2_WOLCO|nr:hypothetical protein WOLCODRAFT_140416 [Wolfiporia cocos MD-104 SS10]